MSSQPTQRLALDLSKYPKLDAKQAGHLRHIHNLAAQADGAWHHMGALESAQEWLDALRYQLATMAYAAAAAHFHRLPAARSVFRPLLRGLVRKMLHPQVWGYWYLTSQSGSATDPGRTELRAPWADPVARENIMYSGHLLLMASLCGMLFDDGEWEEEGAMVFRWSPLFWGFGPEEFRYDVGGLQGAVVAEMERNGWVGVCCEPNVVFVVCNQFPLIAMRLNDVRNGTNLVDEVLVKYRKAWEEKGMVGSDGLFVDWIFMRQDRTMDAADIAFTAWANAFMNSWNSDLVHSLYKKQALGYITVIDSQVRLQSDSVAKEYRKLVADPDTHKDSNDLLSKARAEAAKQPPHPLAYRKPAYGYVLQWLSELGKETELNGLLRYADERLRPTWEKGGLYYPRNDTFVDEEDERMHMDPYTGNAGIAYARLNVKDGQKIMWEKPWTREALARKPWVDGIELSSGVDCLRSVWVEEKGVLVLTLKGWEEGKEVEVGATARNLGKGTWAAYVDGKLSKTETIETADGGLGVVVTVGSTEVDIVFMKVV